MLNKEKEGKHIIDHLKAKITSLKKTTENFQNYDEPPSYIPLSPNASTKQKMKFGFIDKSIEENTSSLPENNQQQQYQPKSVDFSFDISQNNRNVISSKYNGTLTEEDQVQDLEYKKGVGRFPFEQNQEMQTLKNEMKDIKSQMSNIQQLLQSLLSVQIQNEKLNENNTFRTTQRKNSETDTERLLGNPQTQNYIHSSKSKSKSVCNNPVQDLKSFNQENHFNKQITARKLLFNHIQQTPRHCNVHPQNKSSEYINKENSTINSDVLYSQRRYGNQQQLSQINNSQYQAATENSFNGIKRSLIEDIKYINKSGQFRSKDEIQQNCISERKNSFANQIFNSAKSPPNNNKYYSPKQIPYLQINNKISIPQHQHTHRIENSKNIISNSRTGKQSLISDKLLALISPKNKASSNLLKLKGNSSLIDPRFTKPETHQMKVNNKQNNMSSGKIPNKLILNILDKQLQEPQLNKIQNPQSNLQPKNIQKQQLDNVDFSQKIQKEIEETMKIISQVDRIISKSPNKFEN